LHIHVYWKLFKKVNIKDARKLDLVGEDGKRYHGNYKATYGAQGWKQYLTTILIHSVVPIFSLPLKLTQILGTF